ncbi:molybdate ABC transporter substrate-binding protein [Bacillus sp. 03113]|uniref:molybdate ABC transporter substrate-binding protein n=1 Tax=Bacillus sp. 03113 TaxID=2578211 RepID=UPI0011443C89|nr:molybdate ABC transporter substrate-binding protein [Bacillus sp. 03113]
MKKMDIDAFVKSFLLVILLFGVVGCSKEPVQQQEEPKTLFAYVGANLKNPITDLAESYEEKTGVKVELTFNNSGALLNQVETMKKGDIYMPGGMPFVEQAKQKGHIVQVISPIAYHTPVIITPKDNSGQVSSVEDLSKQGVKLVIPDKDATAIGRTAYKIFEKTGKTSDIEKNIIANLESPHKVLSAITMGQGNAGIVEYSNTFNIQDKIEVIEIAPELNEVEAIPIASLAYSTDKKQALDFLKYVEEKGPEVFEKYGFKTKKP